MEFGEEFISFDVFFGWMCLFIFHVQSSNTVLKLVLAV